MGLKSDDQQRLIRQLSAGFTLLAEDIEAFGRANDKSVRECVLLLFLTLQCRGHSISFSNRPSSAKCSALNAHETMWTNRLLLC